MNKKALYGIAAFAIAAVATVNVSLNSQSNKLSAMASANTEALAQGEWGCGGNSTHVPNQSLQEKTCVIFISYRLTCQTQTNVCCDPSQQTSCSGHNPGVDI